MAFTCSSLRKGGIFFFFLGHIVIELVGVPALEGSHEPKVDCPGYLERDIPRGVTMAGINGELDRQHTITITKKSRVVGTLDVGSGEEPPGFTSAYFPAIWAISTPNHITQSDLRGHPTNPRHLYGL